MSQFLNIGFFNDDAKINYHFHYIVLIGQFSTLVKGFQVKFRFTAINIFNNRRMA